MRIIAIPLATALAALSIGVAVAAQPPAAARALDDPTIVAIFDAANTADIETGQLAAERGASKEVREFGAMLVTAHRQVRQQGRDLAAKLAVTPTPPKDDASAKAHAAAMTRLRGLEGAAFDQAFLQHEVDFHRSVLDAVRTTLLPAIRNAELRELVVKVAPAFEGHMLGAQHLQRRLAAGSPAR
jgi:putative membrane protein